MATFRKEKNLQKNYPTNLGMEVALKMSAGSSEEGAINIEKKRILQSNYDEEDRDKKYILLKDDQLESAKAEMCEVRQENQRLKLNLDKMMMDYQILQKKLQNISHDQIQTPKRPAVQDLLQEDSEFVSLSLGRTTSFPIDQGKGDDYNKKNIPIPRKADEAARNFNLQDKEGLVKLGLDCNFDVPETSTPSPLNPTLDQNSSEEVKEGLRGETKGSPNKGVKASRNADDIENSAQQNPAKKARVSVRVRCDTPTMNDGCQWRKYGQKIAKGNPCPRAYYRCTVAPSCPVRKQVQRCSEDMSILITTYEGTHSHPLPISATAMASTTSAAAVMLLSGSSSSFEPGPSLSATAIAAQQLHGLNFYLSKPNSPFYLLNSSNTSSPSCPTITLDLANTSSSSSSHFNPLSTSNNFGPRYNSINNYSTNLNFSTTTLEASPSHISWNYGNNAHQSPINQVGSLNFGNRQPQENLYHSFMQKRNGNNNVTPTQQSSQSIEAATKAITSDPNFQSALAAALTSIFGTNKNGSQNVKLEPPFPMVKSTSFGLQPLNLQSSSLRFLSPPLPVSSSKSNSPASPGGSNS